MGTREDILDAAARIMRTEGFARATTKQIARAAGYSEAALYKHFPDKTEIFLCVLGERLPGLSGVLCELPGKAGRQTVRANLNRVTTLALEFYLESFPIAVSVFSSQKLLATHRDRMHARDAGPQCVVAALAEYLAAERRLGRIRRGTDVRSAATLLVGSCFHEAFLLNFAGESPSAEELKTRAAGLTRTVLAGLAP